MTDIDNKLIAAIKTDFRQREHEDLLLSDKEIMFIMTRNTFKNLNDQHAFLVQANENFKLRQDLAVGATGDNETTTVFIDENGDEQIEGLDEDEDGIPTKHVECDPILTTFIYAYIALCYAGEFSTPYIQLIRDTLSANGIREEHAEQFLALVISSIGNNDDGAIV